MWIPRKRKKLPLFIRVQCTCTQASEKGRGGCPVDERRRTPVAVLLMPPHQSHARLEVDNEPYISRSFQDLISSVRLKLRPALTDVITLSCGFPVVTLKRSTNTSSRFLYYGPFIVPLMMHLFVPRSPFVILSGLSFTSSQVASHTRCLRPCSPSQSTSSSPSAMSSPPHRSRLPTPASASSPTFPSRRRAGGCETSTHSPLASPKTRFGSAPAPCPGTADRCGANTDKRSPVSPPPLTTCVPQKCSPGSRLRTSSRRTSVCVRSAVAGTPAVGPVRYVFPHPFTHGPALPPKVTRLFY